ncbi:class I SAM-dependent methyltransferase [Nocardiopsis changdeensis]|uniref:Class I SAM-dependent methyltransferase n=1 Tax=Nocardiopsis changdeensis TaxID=2831969 RepID=A0ABX8BTL9_9ACTN|nr:MULTISPECIES: class I SAM-dependent methyltransferase [Nocardiopsis]QUX25564.1 class I SAM-dependent methyltransferase [Nocardiopsis changdeensis]QYX35950.1 class I SAM-dependent methyltransferase [Nocardiopsis sp. MT53]
MDPRKWTDEAAIARWDASATREAMEAHGRDGDFAKRHLANPALLRMLGPVSGLRVLDAGSGDGYLSRMLAARGARVVGLEPAGAMVAFAREREESDPLGVEYVQGDLARTPVPGGPFDAVVCSMVLMAVPDWRPAMAACARALRPGGLFVFGIVHPAFEGLAGSWRRHGEYRQDRYLEEYVVHGPAAPDFHRPLSAYLNEVAALGLRLREVAEPGLDPDAARGAVAADPGVGAYVRMPNFLFVAAEVP